jgi:hypothetical protein
VLSIFTTPDDLLFGGAAIWKLVDPFVTHRGLLFTVAYEMLGSATDAEDASYGDLLSP